MICRKATFTVSVSAVTLSNAILRLPEHKNPDFVLEKPENKGFRPQKRTKMPILCSGMVAASPTAPTEAQQRPPELSVCRWELPPCNLPPCIPPGILPCIPPANLPPCATAGAYYLALGPAPSGRVIRM